MKNIIPAALFLITSVAGFAQQQTADAKITAGPVLSSNGSEEPVILGRDTDGVFVVFSKKHGHVLSHIDKNLVNDRKISFPDQFKHNAYFRSFYSVMMAGNELYLLTVLKDRGAKTLTLFAQEIDKETLVPYDELKPVFTIADLPSKYSFSLTPASVFFKLFDVTTTLSIDKSTIYFYRKTTLSNRMNVHINAFDTKMKPLWDNEINLPYDAEMFTLKSLKADNNGNLTMNGIYYPFPVRGRMTPRGGLPDYQYRHIIISDEGKRTTDFNFMLENQFITDIKTGTAPDGKLIAVGFYADKKSFIVKGAFYMVIDTKTGLPIKQLKQEFEPDFITHKMRTGKNCKIERHEPEDNGVLLYEFDLQNMTIMNDGSVTVIAEQFYKYSESSTYYQPGSIQTTQTPIGGTGGQVVNTRVTSSSTTTISSSYFIYNDIFVLHFNANGSIEWKSKTPKHQHTKLDNGSSSSYASASHGNTIYLLFNDSKANQSLDKGSPRALPDGAASIVTVDTTNGTATRKLLTTPNNIRFSLSPKTSLQTGEREIFIFNKQGKNKYQPLHVQFDNQP
jgi:hypothetical protein